MKILMIGPHKDKVKGGMSRVIQGYYDSELVTKYEIIAINTVVDGCKFIKMLWFVGSYIKMLAYLIFKNIDLVHVHVASRKSFYRKAFYIKLAKIFKKKIVLHLHGGEFDIFYWNECSDRRRKRISKILNMSDKIIALGEDWKSKIQKYCSVDVTVVYNSVEIRDVNLYKCDSKNILFMGRIEREKGIFDLIEAAKYIIKEQNDINFILAGNGDLLKVRSIIKDNNLQHNFKLLGWVEYNDIKDLLNDAMICILPSYNEGMPMCILEAMSYGIPIIASNVGSIPEIIKNEKNGFLIEPGNVDMIKDTLLYLSKNFHIRKKISEQNFNDVNKKYSNKINCKIISNIYEELSLHI